MLRPEVLQWFRQLQTALLEQYQLDTTRKEDLGRLRLCRMTHQLRLNGKKLPVPFHDLPNQLTDEQDRPVPFEVTPLYAFMEGGAGDAPYEVPMPDDEEARNIWMLEQQVPFNIREKADGRLFIESDLTDDQLNRIYENAKDGRLYVTRPGGSICAQENCPVFVSVGRDGCEPCFLPLCTAQAADRDAVAAEMLEQTDYARTADPEFLLNRVESIQETLLRNAAEEQALRNETYECYFWETRHFGLTPMSRGSFRFYLHTLPDTVSEQLGLDPDYPNGTGLETCFVRGSDGTMQPLFPDPNGLRTRLEQTRPQTLHEIRTRLSGALENGGLYLHGTKTGDPGVAVSAFLKRGNDGSAEIIRLDQPKPAAATKLQQFLHTVFRFCFRRECAREQELEQLFRTAEEDCARMTALQDALLSREAAPEAAQTPAN